MSSTSQQRERVASGVACTTCTFLNAIGARRCEICDTPLSAAQSASPPVQSVSRSGSVPLDEVLRLLPALVAAAPGSGPASSSASNPAARSLFPSPDHSSSVNAFVEMESEERKLEQMLHRTDLKLLKAVKPSTTNAMEAMKDHLGQVTEWWEQMEDVLDRFLSQEEQQQIIASVHVDNIYPKHWPEAKVFTDDLRAATDLPDFILKCHSSNAMMAAQLRQCLAHYASRSHTTEELQDDAVLFALRDRWLAFKKRPTVFHASTFCNVWCKLRLKIQVEVDNGLTPISSPLLLGGVFAVEEGVPVCRRILEQRIAALRKNAASNRSTSTTGWVL